MRPTDPAIRSRGQRPPPPSAVFRTARPAFTLVEILIVVVILGILAAIVIPRFSNAALQTREATLKDELRFLRTQIAIFKAQHRDVPPGHPGGNPASPATSDDFIAQMTNATDQFASIGVSSPIYKFGPYLSKMPANPLNSLDSIRVTTADPLPAPDGSTGWTYNPVTLQFAPNLAGNDMEAVPYANY